MPQTFCTEGGCNQLIDLHSGGRCAAHKQERTRDNNRMPGRAESRSFYKSKAWRDLRESVLSRRPLCLHCLRDGRTTLADHVDHIQPRVIAPGRALDPTNLQPLCRRCHGRKTAGEVWGDRSHAKGRSPSGAKP